MTQQARTTDPDTSHDWVHHTNSTVADKEKAILGALAVFNCGLTSAQLATLTGERVEHISPRLRPMARREDIHERAEKYDGRIVWMHGPSKEPYVEPDRISVKPRVASPLTGKDVDLLRVLEKHPRGLTSLELAAHLHRPLVAVSPQLRPMVRAGCVKGQGRRAGRIIWKVAY